MDMIVFLILSIDYLCRKDLSDLQWSLAANNAQQNHDDGNDEQDMDEST
jgi:hypothetical protein